MWKLQKIPAHTWHNSEGRGVRDGRNKKETHQNSDNESQSTSDWDGEWKIKWEGKEKSNYPTISFQFFGDEIYVWQQFYRNPPLPLQRLIHAPKRNLFQRDEESEV